MEYARLPLTPRSRRCFRSVPRSTRTAVVHIINMSRCPRPAGGISQDNDKFPSFFWCVFIHSTWTDSFRGRCAGQNHVIESILGSGRSLYSVSDYHSGSGSSCSAHASTFFLAKSLDSFIPSSCRLQSLYTPSQELRFCLPSSLQSSTASPTPYCNHYLRTPQQPD